MDNYGTNLAEAFAANAVVKFYDMAVTPMITNDSYEGQIKDKASRLNILTFTESEGLQDYDGSDLSEGEVQEVEGVLNTDQQKAYYFRIKSIDRFKSYVTDPESTLVIEKAGQLSTAVDQYVLNIAQADTAAGNRIGTDETAGTVAINNSGVVSGSGTSFSSDMIGLGFRATGHTKWYRVRGVSGPTSMTIELDVDDQTATYDGGAISSNTSYVVEAVSPVEVTMDNAYSILLRLNKRLSDREIPDQNRWCAIDPAFKMFLLQANVIVRDTEQGEKRTTNAMIARIGGLNLYESTRTAGNDLSGNGNGRWIQAGHKLSLIHISEPTRPY